ncbi:hypothetical protein OG689_40530 [Kitasatospora sp. NBC_00240]|uniref:hypothetical protein n=1 Tax=Kitasatospora sp. NBC_00240 TaxID=2903567 RepID=UPI002253F2BA|nr:hypothetical protein [Kitasatospora sp. NBC_00240]MCX5215462.1 hypothetical protein [Kitasatospora sp. NBC_00240]
MPRTPATHTGAARRTAPHLLGAAAAGLAKVSKAKNSPYEGTVLGKHFDKPALVLAGRTSWSR